MSIDRIDTQDVFVASDKGNDELKGGSTRLSPLAIELLVIFDGKLNLGEALAKLRAKSRARVPIISKAGVRKAGPKLVSAARKRRRPTRI